MALVLRPLMPDDVGDARICISAQFAGTRYEVRALEQLDIALQFDDPEYMALLASSGDDVALRGLVLFGTVAGARGVVKVHVLVGRGVETAVALLGAVRATSEHSGERMIVCELPDDTPLTEAADALDASGFVEAGRVPDFVTDGVALRLLVHTLVVHA